MKYWLLAVLILNGCSSAKKERDFQESLDRPDEVTPEIEVKAPEKLLEKFEVKKIDTPEVPKNDDITAAGAVKSSIKTPKKNPIPVAEKKKTLKKDSVIFQSNKLPADYPEEMIKINGKAEAVWKYYKPNHFVNEKVYLDIHYLGMTVGKIMVTNRGKEIINGKEVWHFHSRFKSAPFYSSIYELDDTVDTYVTTDQFLSIKYALIQRESKQDVDDLQLNDRDQMSTFWFYKQKKSDGTLRNKEKKAYIPYFSIDPFSVLFFYQGLPMKNGDVYEIPIINKAKILILKSEVEGREKINTEIAKDVKAIRVHATTKYTGETLKDGDLYFWFTDDNKRTLIKAQAKIKIGSVTADIVDGK
jgi:hypothetical protein